MEPAPPSSWGQKLYASAFTVVEPALKYFLKTFYDESSKFSLVATVQLFKAAQVIDPRVSQYMSAEAVQQSLDVFPVLSPKYAALLSELPLLQTRAQTAVFPDNAAIFQFYMHFASDLPTWLAAAQYFAVMQPSSAPAERVFSILKRCVGDQQHSMLHDYMESMLMEKMSLAP